MIVRVFSGIYLDIGIFRVHPYGIYYMECLIESTLLGVEQRIGVDNTWGFPYSESSSSSSPTGAIASDNAPGGFPRSQSYKSSVKKN